MSCTGPNELCYIMRRVQLLNDQEKLIMRRLHAIEVEREELQRRASLVRQGRRRKVTP